MNKRDRYGLPAALAATDHLGKQLAAKRRAEAKLRDSNFDLPAAQISPKKGAKVAKSAPQVLGKRCTAQEWFAARGWQPFRFQTQTWAHIAKGKSGLVHASTGTGKTFAIWLGLLEKYRDAPSLGCKVLWITPMRALAADTTKALANSAHEMGVNWRVESRTGDTDAAEKARQTKALPDALVTTPESVSLLLARADASEILRSVCAIVVDEWHELIGNKRGVQTQLAIARIRQSAPQVLIWGVSATLGNLPQAQAVLLGPEKAGVRISGKEPKTIAIDTLLPATMERFPWAGHIGLKLLPQVIAEIESSASTLIFTNVRSASEIWYQQILNARPDWAGVIAVHHGSLSKDVRSYVEDALKSGALKAVVCTSSLDLGVDFLPVERVLQIGSPKGIARLLQRAGRSGHAPRRASRITIVPTQALEIIEAAAARTAAAQKKIEARTPPIAPLDVLVQHMVTLGTGAGFSPDGLFDEVRTTHAYATLTREAFDWCLHFASDGGAMHAYPDYHKLVRNEAGIYRVENPAIARRHRMSIGTIVSDGAMDVKWQSGGKLGSIEESFIARLKVGDVFSFAGHVLELTRVRDMIASVKKSKRKTGIVPQWGGGRLPLSTELADATLAVLGEMARGRDATPEARAMRPLIDEQIQRSALPTPQQLVMEAIQSEEGAHFYCYAFAGRLAHIGLAALIGWRASAHDPATFSFSANDYGFELHSQSPFDWARLISEGLFSIENLEDDIVSALNASELSKRRFREIARVAGLIFQGFPGAPHSTKQLQVSSALLFEVFNQHDPDNQLLVQARNEALRDELDLTRIHAALIRINALPHVILRPARFTPFSFPLMAERLRDTVSTESLTQRLQKLAAALEAGT